MSQDPPAHDPARPEHPTVPEVAEVSDVASAPEDGGSPENNGARGVRALTAEQFSVSEAVGGVRGMIEAVAPGLVFVVVYVATMELTPALVASVAVALVAVVARLVQRTPVTQAFGGMLGVAIGVVWAWRSGDASDYFVWGLWVNTIYLVPLLVSILVRWPVVGLVVEGLRAGFGTTAVQDENVQVRAALSRWARSWRSDPVRMRRYAIATWLWVALFAVRLAVQVPLYFQGSVGWLGTARLVMGLPLWALVLWLTWVLVRRTSPAPGTAPGTAPDAAPETAREAADER